MLEGVASTRGGATRSACSSLDTVLSVASNFDLDSDEARLILGEVADAVSRWRDSAASVGLGRNAVDRMHSAFEHADLAAALRMR